jgi:hypothetical protein
MAWVDIPNKAGWQYDNSVDNSRTVIENGEEVYITYKDSPGTITNGIRTYTNESGNVCKVYVRCRQISNPDRILDEVSKTFLDKE